MTKLKGALQQYKDKAVATTAPKHEIWVPAPEKAEAKAKGAKWNDADKRWEFASNTPAEHFCSRFLPSNYVPLSAQVPYDLKNVLRDVGVVTVEKDGVWQSYVMADDKYKELIEMLGEYELL